MPFFGHRDKSHKIGSVPANPGHITYGNQNVDECYRKYV